MCADTCKRVHTYTYIHPYPHIYTQLYSDQLACGVQPSGSAMAMLINAFGTKGLWGEALGFLSGMCRCGHQSCRTVKQKLSLIWKDGPSFHFTLSSIWAEVQDAKERVEFLAICLLLCSVQEVPLLQFLLQKAGNLIFSQLAVRKHGASTSMGFLSQSGRQDSDKSAFCDRRRGHPMPIWVRWTSWNFASNPCRPESSSRPAPGTFVMMFQVSMREGDVEIMWKIFGRMVVNWEKREESRQWGDFSRACCDGR